MNTIEKSVLSQVEGKMPHGTGKSKSDGDGKVQGKFAEAFASISAKAGTAKAGRNHEQPLSDSDVKAQPARARAIPAEFQEKALATGADISAQSAGASKSNETATPNHLAAQVMLSAPVATGAEASADSGNVEASQGDKGEAGSAEALDNLSSTRSGETRVATPATALPAASVIAAALLVHSSTVAGEEGEGEGDTAETLDNLLSTLSGETQVATSASVSPEASLIAAAVLVQANAVFTQANAVFTQAKTAIAGEGEGMVAEPGAGQSRNAQAMLAASAVQGAVDAEATATDAPVGDADQIFKLVRADGRAKPIEIAIGGNGEISGGEGRLSAGAEAVTVLDARRYLGLAQQGNSAAVTAAMAQDPSWAAALSDTGPDMTGKVVNTLKIQLQPIDLGTVTATLRLQGDALVVDLKVESGKAYRSLSEDQEAIVKALRGHGFAIDQISVQMSSSSDRGGAAGQGTGQGAAQGDAQQFAGQQQAREGGGRQQGGETRNAPAAFNEGSVHDHAQTDSLISPNQRRSAGGVFL